MLDLDAFAYNNRLSRMSASRKGTVAGVAMVLSMVARAWWLHLLVVVVMSAVVVGMARIPWKAYVKLFAVPTTFLLLSVGTMLVSVSSAADGLTWYRHMGGFYIGISRSSVDMVQVLFGRCMAALSGLYFLSLTTPLNQLVGVLKKVHVPVILIELVVLIYRFIHIFFTAVQDSVHALQLRNGFINAKTARTSIVLLVVMTYTRMMNSYDDWQMVLATKNFNGDFHV